MKSKALIYIIGVISGIILGIIGIFFYFDWAFNQPCPEPVKPANVPLSAVWIGGCDGGNWIELVSIKDNKIRFKIYRDWNGDLILDSDFKYDGCANFRLTESSWAKYIAYYENFIHLYDSSAGLNCRLMPVYPAYFKEKI
jgi:hypothetical protein